MRRILLVAAGVVVVLVVAAVVVVDSVNDGRTAEQAVRDYVELIAQGHGDAATAAVDPRPAGGDPANLTDAVLASATDRIVITGVSADPSDEDEDVVDVRVDYKLGTDTTSVTLRAQRQPDSFGYLHNWRVLDPMLVPVAVTTVVPTFDAARLGPLTVAASGSKYNGFPPPRPVRLYPGTYPLTPLPSQYVGFPASSVRVDHGLVSTGHPLDVTANYQVLPALRTLVDAELAGLVKRCFGVGVKPAADCPEDERDRAGFAKDFVLRDKPVIDRLEPFQTDYKADGSTKPAIRVMTRQSHFTYKYTDEDGMSGQDFRIFGSVDVSKQDKVTVTFTPSL